MLSLISLTFLTVYNVMVLNFAGIAKLQSFRHDIQIQMLHCFNKLINWGPRLVFSGDNLALAFSEEKIALAFSRHILELKFSRHKLGFSGHNSALA